MLIEFRTPRSAGGGNHFRFGQHDLFDTAPDLVGLGQRRPRQRIGLHGQAALVKLRQKRGARPRQRDHGDD